VNRSFVAVRRRRIAPCARLSRGRGERREQTAVRKLEQFAANVPAIFTTPAASETVDRSQTIKNVHAPVAQPG